MKQPRTETWYVLAIVLLAAAFFTIDLLQPLGSFHATIFAVVSLLTVGVDSRRIAILTGIASSVLILLGALASPWPADGEVPWLEVIASRLLALLLVWAVLSLVLMLKRFAVGEQTQRDWFRTTLLAIGDAVIATDEAGRVNFMNASAEALTGWSLGQAVGRPIEEITRMEAEATQEAIPIPVRLVLDEGVPRGPANHMQLVMRDETRVPIECSAAPIRTALGRVIGAVLVFRDIRARRESERASRRSELQARRMLAEIDMLYHTAPIGLAFHDPQMRYVRINEQLASINNLPVAAHIGRTVREVTPETAECIEPLLQQVIATGKPVVDAEIRGISPKTGETAVYSCSYHPLSDSDGQLLGINVVVRDVTSIKQAEEALRLRDRAIASATNGIVIADASSPDLPIVFANQGFTRLTGYEAEEVLGRNCRFLQGPETDPQTIAKVREAVRAERECRVTLLNYRKDGTPFWNDLLLTPIRDETGRATHYMGIQSDITSRREALQALAEANRHKDDFLAMLAHELRNPLSALLSAAQVLARCGGDDPRVESSSATIRRQVEHMARLLDDLLDVSRIARGKIQLRREVVDLNELLSRTIDDQRGSIAQAGLELCFETPEDPVWIEADPTRVAQVFHNLLQNAVKFTDAGGNITVRLELSAAENSARVTVTDTGIGMDPTTLRYVFDAFRQADHSLDRTAGGLGLGLALARGLIRLHGGTVAAHSDGPGAGSRFVVELPCCPPPCPVVGVTDLQERETPAMRILIVDDNRDSVESLQYLLQFDGHTIAVAYDGEQALASAREFHPEVVLCDIGLPKIDGYEVARQLRADPLTREIYLVAFTGYGESGDRQKAHDAGFNFHLTKPVDIDALEQVIGTRPQGSFAELRRIGPAEPRV